MGSITTKAINLREIVAKVLSWKPPIEYETFYWEFDGTGDKIILPMGWEPIWVSVDDDILQGNLGVYLNADANTEFEARSDGFGTWEIVFPSSYPNTSSAMVFAKREL